MVWHQHLKLLWPNNFTLHSMDRWTDKLRIETSIRHNFSKLWHVDAHLCKVSSGYDINSLQPSLTKNFNPSWMVKITDWKTVCPLYFVYPGIKIKQKLEISLKVINTLRERPVTVIVNYSSATCLQYAQLSLVSVILEMCHLILIVVQK